VATVSFRGSLVELRRRESVLDGLLRAGEDVPHSCRSGVCRACTLVAESGELPELAQRGLREVERRQGRFLACQCYPSEDLEVRELEGGASIAARIVAVDHLSDTVVRLRLVPEAPLDYEPGQYVALARSDGLVRSYSLASTPDEPWLEFHLRRLPGGQMSTWAYDEARVGDVLSLRGPYGTCCYPSGETEAPMILVGTGTGLAPLWGVLRQALAAGHRGPITLLQGAVEPAGLYLREELAALALEHPQLRVRACVLSGEGEGIEQGRVDLLAAEQVEATGKPGSHLAFVCGDPVIVQRLRRSLFLAGMSAQRILVDAFIMAPHANSPDAA
jgi:CDP-4-dehydro-6-deoxyglucose reductase